MKISSMFDGSKTVLSFEVFPPKRTMPIETIYKTLEQLDGLHPEFISVTYGAGGGEANKRTLEVASYIKTQYHIEPLMHMTCINSTKADIDQMLKLAQEHDISNIMTLRGDIVPDIEPKDDFHYAADLAAYLKPRVILISAAPVIQRDILIALTWSLMCLICGVKWMLAALI